MDRRDLNKLFLENQQLLLEAMYVFAPPAVVEANPSVYQKLHDQILRLEGMLGKWSEPSSPPHSLNVVSISTHMFPVSYRLGEKWYDWAFVAGGPIVAQEIKFSNGMILDAEGWHPSA